MHRPLRKAKENPEKHLEVHFSPILRSILSSTQCYEGVKVIRLLGFSN